MTETEEYKKRLSEPLHIEDVVIVAQDALKSDRGKQAMVQLLLDTDNRVGSNAAWGLMHIKIVDLEFLRVYRNEMMSKVMVSDSVSHRRLLLALLERLGIDDCCEERVDFLDYCFQRMLMNEEPVGVRALCIKLAHQMCRRYPELEEEFKQSLLLMDTNMLKPGLLSLRNKKLTLQEKESCSLELGYKNEND